MKLKPRDYQTESVNSILNYLQNQKGKHPLVVAPTGSGKSVKMALMCEKIVSLNPNARILLAAHQKELVEQNYEKLQAIAPELNMGIVSASVGRNDTESQVVFGTIGTLHARRDKIGRFDLMIVDECHRIPKKDGGQYRTLIDSQMQMNPNFCVMGYTATPFRLDGGLLHKGKGAIFDGIAYNIRVSMLLERGYISPVVNDEVKHYYDSKLKNVGTSLGDYKKRELSQAVDDADINVSVCNDIVELGKDRKSWLIFCTGIAHAEHINSIIQSKGITSAMVNGKMSKQEREKTLKAFKAGEIQCLTNVDVLTTGFDAPNIDLIAMLRPTQSLSLHQQMLGRGMRLGDEKENCLLLDFAGNLDRHGSMESPILPKPKGNASKASKLCPDCYTENKLSARYCVGCLSAFPKTEKDEEMQDPNLSRLASTAEIIGSKSKKKTIEVNKVVFVPYVSKRGNLCLKLEYCVGYMPLVSEYVPINIYSTKKLESRMCQIFGVNRFFESESYISGLDIDALKNLCDWLRKASTDGTLTQRIKSVDYRVNGEGYQEVIAINPRAEAAA